MLSSMNKFTLAMFLVGLSLLVGLNKPSQALSQEVVDHQFSLLPDWNHQSFDSNVISSLTQRKVIDGSKCLLKVVCFKTPPGVQVETNAEQLHQLSTKEALDSNEKPLSGQATSFQGYPAYITERIQRTSSSTMYTRVLRFTDKHNLYWIQLTLSGDPISNSAISDGDQAWKTVVGTLPNAPLTQTNAFINQANAPAISSSNGYIYYALVVLAVLVIIVLIWKARTRNSNKTRKTLS